MSMIRINNMLKLTKKNMALLLMLLLPIQCFADAEACRSCIDAAGCERENRECASECNLTSFFTEAELTDCGTACTVSWSSCITRAKSGCTYECKDDS